MIEFLDATEARDHIPRISQLEDRLGQDAIERVVLGLDVGREISPHIGVELYAGDGRCLMGAPDRQLLQQLCDIGLARQDIVSAVMRYPGKDRIWNRYEQWPEACRNVLHKSGLASVPACLRLFHHAKVSFNGEKEPSAKAYLAAYFVTGKPAADEFSLLS